MANKILATSQITLVDLNDQISLSSYINSTVPQMQLISNQGTYLPSWSLSAPVTLTAELFKIGYSGDSIIDSSDVKAIRWYYKLATQTSYIPIEATGGAFQLVGTAPKFKQLKIINNLMTKQNPGLSIKCEIDYQESWMPVHTQKTEMSFTLSSQGDNGLNGQDSYTIVLTNENQSIVCDANGSPIQGQIGSTGRAKTKVLAYKGTQSLTAVDTTAQLSNGKFCVTIKNTDGGGTLNRVSGTFDEFYLDGNISDSGYFELEISYEKTSNAKGLKRFTYAKVKPGASAIIATLTNESQTIATDKDGNNGNWSICQSAIQLYNGTKVITSGVTYTIDSKSTSITATMNSTGLVQVTNMTTDTGYIDLCANYSSNKYIKRFSISKARAGTGQNATSYWLISPAAIAKDSNNNFNPTAISLKGMFQTGTASAEEYPGRFVIEETEDGITWNKMYASTVNETSVDFIPENTKAKMFKAYLYKTDSSVYKDSYANPAIYDIQTIVVVEDGVDGSPAKLVYLTSTGQTFVTDKNETTTPSSINISADIQGIPEPRTITWQKSVNSGSFSNISGTTTSMSVKSTDVSKGGSATYKINVAKNGITYSDTITIAHTAEGQDSYTAILTNESHVIACNSAGTPNSGEVNSATSKSACEIIAYKGATKLNSVASSATPGVNDFKYVIGTPVGCTVSRHDDATNKVYNKFYITTATADSGKIPVTITYYGGKSITREMSFVKSKAAINAKVLDIVGENTFKSTSQGAITPQNIVLTASTQNVSGTIQWQYWNAATNNWTNLSTGGTLTVTPSSTGWSNNLLRVKAYVQNDTSVYDTFSIVKVVDGSNGTSSVNLSVWGPKGLLIHNGNAQSIALEALMYEGSTNITQSSGVKYTWKKLMPNGSTEILQATATGNANGYKVNVSADVIPVSLPVICEAEFNKQIYKTVITVEDKMDPIQVDLISTNGEIFKKGQNNETYLYPKLIRNGEELDIVTIYDSVPSTSGHKNGDIIYVKSDKKYRELVSSAWTVLSSYPSTANGKSDFDYVWTKYTAAGVPSEFGKGKVLYVNSQNVAEKASFVVSVEG